MEDQKQLQPQLLLPLNLQAFAEDPEDPSSDPEPVPNVPEDPPGDPKREEDTQLNPLSDDERSELIKLRKQVAISSAGITDPDDVQNAMEYLEDATDPDEMAAVLRDLLDDLKVRERMSGVDPSPGNGARSRYMPSDGTEVGRSMYQRIKNRRKR